MALSRTDITLIGTFSLIWAASCAAQWCLSVRRPTNGRPACEGAQFGEAVPALFTAQSLVTFSPSLNENVSGIDAPAWTHCFGFSSIT